MGFYENLLKSGRGLLDDLWILAGAVADDDCKDDLAAIYEAMSKPSDMFDGISGFLESCGDAPDLTKNLEVVQDEQPSMCAEPSEASITNPVVKYAAANLLSLRNKVWADAKSAA